MSSRLYITKKEGEYHFPVLLEDGARAHTTLELIEFTSVSSLIEELAGKCHDLDKLLARLCAIVEMGGRDDVGVLEELREMMTVEPVTSWDGSIYGSIMVTGALRDSLAEPASPTT